MRFSFVEEFESEIVSQSDSGSESGSSWRVKLEESGKSGILNMAAIGLQGQ